MQYFMKIIFGSRCKCQRSTYQNFVGMQYGFIGMMLDARNKMVDCTISTKC